MQTLCHTQLGSHVLSVSLKKHVLALSFHMKCCYAAHCFLNLSQQEAAAAAVTSLSTSPSRPGRAEEATDGDLSLPASHRGDERRLSAIISQAHSPADLLSASLLEFMEQIKPGVKLRFLLKSASLRQNATQT